MGGNLKMEVEQSAP